MTQFRMRHANGLEEMLAQMQRHFLRQPEQEPQPGWPAEQQAAREQQAVQDSQQQRQRPWDEQPREARLAELAAAQAVLVDAFNRAAAEGRDPVAAAAAAAAAAAGDAAASATHGSVQPEGPAAAPTNAAPAPAPEPQEQLEQQQELERRQYVTFSDLSQLQQALAYQTAVHQWRRNKANPAARVSLAWELATVMSLAACCLAACRGWGQGSTPCGYMP